MDSSKPVKKLTKRLILIQVAVVLLLVTAGAIIVLRRITVEPFVDYRAQMRELAIHEFGENPDPQRTLELLREIILIANTTYLEDATAEVPNDLSRPDGEVDIDERASASHPLLDWNGEPWKAQRDNSDSILPLVLARAQDDGILSKCLAMSEFLGTPAVPVIAPGWSDESRPGVWQIKDACDALQSLLIVNALNGDSEGMLQSFQSHRILCRIMAAEPAWTIRSMASNRRSSLLALLREGVLRGALDGNHGLLLLPELNQVRPATEKEYLLRVSELESMAEIQSLYQGDAKYGVSDERISNGQVVELKALLPYSSAIEKIRSYYQSLEQVAMESNSRSISDSTNADYLFSALGLPIWTLDYLPSISNTDIKRQFLQHDHNCTSAAALRILLAIEIHRERNGGTPPATLDEIADLLGGTIPIDAMSGLPFVYHPDAAAAGFAGVSDTPYILYSAGLNGIIHNNPTADLTKAREPGFDYLWSALPKDDD